MISVNDIAVEFSGQTLFKGVNFVINEGDRIALMGKNGAGKSTMMKIIAGVETPTKGKVQVPKEAVIAYLPQHLLTDDNCTVFEETAKAWRINAYGVRGELKQYTEEDTVTLMGIAHGQANSIRTWTNTKVTKDRHN